MPESAEYAEDITLRTLKIILNGEPFEADGPLTVSGLLTRLQIDSRRVAVEHNLVVLKKAVYGATAINEGDQVEIVNFVGGGEVNFVGGGEAGPVGPAMLAGLKARSIPWSD